jgi:hypothetical protein
MHTRHTYNKKILMLASTIQISNNNPTPPPHPHLHGDETTAGSITEAQAQPDPSEPQQCVADVPPKQPPPTPCTQPPATLANNRQEPACAP